MTGISAEVAGTTRRRQLATTNISGKPIASVPIRKIHALAARGLQQVQKEHRTGLNVVFAGHGMYGGKEHISVPYMRLQYLFLLDILLLVVAHVPRAPHAHV